MFERYTEGARRTIFFARYEAAQVGSGYIETEHILLGLLREDKALFKRLLPAVEYESIHKEVVTHTRLEGGKNPALSADLPLSNESKRALAFWSRRGGTACSSSYRHRTSVSRTASRREARRCAALAGPRGRPRKATARNFEAANAMVFRKGFPHSQHG